MAKGMQRQEQTQIPFGNDKRCGWVQGCGGTAKGTQRQEQTQIPFGNDKAVGVGRALRRGGGG